jgi:uncharacterized repeat protein (TIGR01451 family)
MGRLDACALALVVSLAVAVDPLAQEGPGTDAPPPPPAGVVGPTIPIAVLHTNLPGDPTAQVPGHPGIEFGPGTGTTHFDRPYGSPNGNWILSADTTYPTTEDEVILVNDVVVVREGTPALWTAGENTGLIDTALGINDAGEFVFATNTDGPTTADDYIVLFSGGTFTAAAQEGQPIPALPPATYDDLLDSPVVASDGTVGLSADGVDGGPPTTQDDLLILGATLLAQEGVTVPPGQIGMEFWENFDLSDFHISTDGSSWLVQGDLTGATASDGVVAVDGAVVVQEGVILPASGFPDPVDLSGIVGVHMDPLGNWFVRGNNDISEQDWVYGNGAVLATLGDPIFTGSAELWSDAEFADCFFLHVGGAGGHYVIGGVSDGPTAANGVLVLDGTDVVVRESDPFDLDGNGMFDDDTFFNTFGNDDGVLTDAGLFYFTATIKDGTGTVIGQGFFVADLSGVIGGPGGTDLAVAKTESADPVAAGSTLTYTITLSNDGPLDATGIEVTETLTLPAGVTVQSVTPGQGTFADPVWSAGDLVVGADATLTVVLDVGSATVPGTDVISDTAAITAADQPLINTGDDSVTESTSVTGAAVVTGTMTVSGDFSAGGTVVYTVILTNGGNLDTGDNPGSEFHDILPLPPPGVFVDDATVISGGGTVLVFPFTNDVTWDGGIPAGGSVVLSIEATVAGAPGSTVSNQGQIAYDSDGSGDNDASAVTDDPAAPGAADPTAFVIGQSVLEIPALGGWGLLLLALALALAGLALARRSAGAAAPSGG